MSQDDLFVLEGVIERAAARISAFIERRGEELSAPVRELIEFARRSTGQRTRLDRLHARQRMGRAPALNCEFFEEHYT